MKYAFESAVAALVIVGAAVAQTTTPPTPPTPPAAPVAPSTCPAYPTPPTLPAADAIKNQRDLDAANVIANGHITAFNTVHTCRLAEIAVLKGQFDTRAAEARTGQASVLSFSDAWKATGAAVVARSAKNGEETRTRGTGRTGN